MTKYSDETVHEICKLLRDGYTKRDAAAKVGIEETTFYAWMRDKSQFSQCVKDAERDFLKVRGRKVIDSLYKRATGYDVEETETTYGNWDGQPIVRQTKVKKRHIPADPKALTFLLTNLYPDEWKDKQQNELTGTLSNKVTIEYVDSGIELAHSEDEITD